MLSACKCPLKSNHIFLLLAIILLFEFSFKMTNAFTPQSISTKSEQTMKHMSSDSNIPIYDDNQDDTIAEEKEVEGVRLGFIGCGTIASAIATGLLSQTQIPILSITLSRRSESKSSVLKQTFGDDIIQISDENQIIVDRSDIIFLCVLPQQEKEVLSNLNISDDKILISLVVRVY